MEVSIMREEFDLENRQKLLYKEDASLKEYHFNIQGISEGMAEALKPFAMAVVEYEEPGNHHLAAEMNALQLLEAGRKMCCTAVGEVLGNEWVKITEALTAIDPVLSNFIVPKCIYRGGICTGMSPVATTVMLSSRCLSKYLRSCTGKFVTVRLSTITTRRLTRRCMHV